MASNLAACCFFPGQLNINVCIFMTLLFPGKAEDFMVLTHFKLQLDTEGKAMVNGNATRRLLG